MAEILLSLTIIGVVAAITLPSLTGNINERTWNTQRKALYARMSQAISLMPALNGYGTLTEDADGNVTADTAAETFVTEGLAKVLKINNICDSEHLIDCGIPTKLNTIKGETISAFPTTIGDLNSHMLSATQGSRSYKQINTKVSAFETQNAESIAVFYNPYCSGDSNSLNRSMNDDFFLYVQPFVCANFIYDLNGNKGPNTVGKDIGFISAIYPTDTSVVAPMPLNNDISEITQIAALGECKKVDSESRLPNIHEMMSMFVNRSLWGATQNRVYWTSTIVRTYSVVAYYLNMSNGSISTTYRDQNAPVRCIKR